MKLQLNDRVRLELSEERGKVIAIAVSDEIPEQYFVRYRAADGCQVESWFHREALVLER